MLRTFNYEVGDYVRYQGNMSTLTKILRDPDVGRIEEFGNNVGRERVYLYLIKAKKYIWCDFYDIRQIFTEPEHLKALNFNTVDVKGYKKYELDGVTVSGSVIYTKPTTYLINYCIADFSQGVQNIEKYLLEDGSLNLEKFYTDFPNVNNLNDLLKYLKSTDRQIDEDKIACS
jgi:hypothetical protein